MNTKTHEVTFSSVLAQADSAEKVINGKKEQVAQALMGIAAGLTTADQFEAGCVAAEAARKARISEIAVDKGIGKAERKILVRLPSSWSNAKSVLLRGWADHGLIPNDYETFSQFKDAKDAAVKAVKEPRHPKASDTATDGASAQMEKGSVTQVLFSDLMLRVSKLSTENQELIALELESIISQYESEVTPTEEVGEDDSEAVILAALEDEQIRQASA